MAIIPENIFYPSHELIVPLPANSSPETEKYYNMTSKGPVRECKVMELENVYANRELVLWKNRKIIPEAFALDWLVEKLYGKPKDKAKFIIKNTLRKKVEIKEPVLWCIDQYTTGGYYHWITEVVPRLWLVRRYYEDLMFAVPDYFLEKWPFVQQFFDLLGIKKLLILENRNKYLIKHLVMPTRPGAPFYRQHEPVVNGVEWLRHNAFQQGTKDNGQGERLYISRNKAKYRKVMNEEELLPVLEKYGFRRIYLEEYSLVEQIRLCSEASVLMGVHGAGLVNMSFMRQGSKLIEIRPDNAYHIYNCFHTLAAHFPAQYYFILCDYAHKPLKEDKRIVDYSLTINPLDLDRELMTILRVK